MSVTDFFRNSKSMTADKVAWKQLEDGGRSIEIKIEDFFAKNEADLKRTKNKVIDALLKYANKVKLKRGYYSAYEKKWYPFEYPFEFGERKIKDELDRISGQIHKLKNIKSVGDFNTYISLALKNMILGGVEEERELKSENFRDIMPEPEDISDRDIRTLEELEICIYNIRSRAMKEKGIESMYDNITLDNFMDQFTVMIDDIKRKKNIKDYIAHRPGPQLEISTPVV